MRLTNEKEGFVCAGDANIADMKAISDTKGYVEFNNIPSVHEYVLIEEEPENYVPINNRTVIVSYGDTYIDAKMTENKLVDGVFEARNNEAFVVINEKVEPVSIQIQTTKTMDGKAPEAGKYGFKLVQTSPASAAY